jgi:hypothetical protein
MGKVKHGLCSTPEYYIWKSMRQRCNNPKSNKYYIYGARGIKVCDRWSEFINFYEDMGRRPNDEYSIDRIDVNGDYEPKNCRWVTIEIQSKNKRHASDRTRKIWTNNLGIRNKGKIYSESQKDKISDLNCKTRWGNEKYNNIVQMIIEGRTISSIRTSENVNYNSLKKLKNRLKYYGEE